MPYESRLRLVLANGSLAAYPQGGGHWTVFLQYLIGLHALGHDVFWLELLPTTGDKSRDKKLIRIFLTRFRHYGFADRCAVLLVRNHGSPVTLDLAEVYGVSKEAVETFIRSADLVWNLCCTLRQPFLSLFKHRALIDLDPGIVQVPDYFDAFAIGDHQTLLTVGSKIGAPDCLVPTFGLNWHHFKPFLDLGRWRSAPDPGGQAPFTSVTQWTWNEIWYQGRIYSASKRASFMNYLELPRRVTRPFELAANILRTDATGDRELLRENGWRLVHPHRVARSPALYQNYIKNARAEFSCVKPIYRELKTGWFSDRSACFLASGRPVLAEDTGFSEHLPTGHGLLTFTSMEEAIERVADIDAKYTHHMRAAREIAEEYLNAKVWLPRMLAVCGW